MKTIAYQDIQGGGIYLYKGKDPKQKRHDRISEGLKELKHTGRIKVFLIDGNKTRKLFSKGY